MMLDDKTIAIIAVLVSVCFLATLTVVTYRCNPSLFKRQHRHMPGRPRPKVSRVDTERIDPEKLTRFVSQSSLRSYASPSTTGRLATKDSKASSLTTTSEVVEEEGKETV